MSDSPATIYHYNHWIMCMQYLNKVW